MESTELVELIETARGDAPADLLLTNAQLVNVFTGEIYPTDIAVKRSRVAALGRGYRAGRVIDLGGRYVCPGLIDAHVHIESSLCPPPEFAKAVLVHGVTSVVSDPHEIANVLGLEGIHYMLQEAKYGPISMYVMASSCVPATHMQTAGAYLKYFNLDGLRYNEWVLGLAEVMNYPGVIMADKDVIRKINMYQDMVIDGHAPGVNGQALSAYVAAGIRSDHECTTPEEMIEKLRLGMTIFIREASGARNLHDLLPALTPENAGRVCFCTDDRHPADLIDYGSIDYIIRTAIAAGVDPVTAIRMGTINAATHFRLHDQGVIAPGRRADMVVFSDLYDFRPEMVFRGGRLVAQDGVALVGQGRAEWQPHVHLRSSMNVRWEAVDFTVPAEGARARVIGSIPAQVVTDHLIEDVTVLDGAAVPDPARDLLKIAVVERHRASGNIGKGFIKGIGLKRGAIAGTVAHDHHNLVIIGADDISMYTAAEKVSKMGGGLVAAEGEHVHAALPLPIAGLMSDQPITKVREAIDKLTAAAQSMGAQHEDPFMTMSFMALEVIPKLKLTDVGLVDVEQFKVVDLWAG
ncbi:MAG: adenine deaminase [Anaerolineae bacterium]|nr:adenine deaminase [Anaerolineae bacterium]